jgi:hypothetical protein
MTQVSQCKLCLLQKELVNSHFLPASIYKLCRDAATGQNLIAVSQGVSKHTTDQIRDYVFCSDCEKRLNKNGEAWFHKNMARPEGFTIQDALEKATPSMIYDSFVAYEGSKIPGLDMDQISYFGLSMFWRAAAHRWPALNAPGLRMERLLLGPCKESIRLFLLNGAPVPPHISLLISVWPYKKKNRHQWCSTHRWESEIKIVTHIGSTFPASISN